MSLIVASYMTVVATVSSSLGGSSSHSSTQGVDANDPRLASCGSNMPGQSPILGSFQADSPDQLYGSVPRLPPIPELALPKTPLFVVMFNKGVFRFPVPLVGSPDGAKFWSQPHTILCVYQDGNPSFYADVDFTGWAAPVSGQ